MEFRLRWLMCGQVMRHQTPSHQRNERIYIGRFSSDCTCFTTGLVFVRTNKIVSMVLVSNAEVEQNSRVSNSTYSLHHPIMESLRQYHCALKEQNLPERVCCSRVGSWWRIKWRTSHDIDVHTLQTRNSPWRVICFICSWFPVMFCLFALTPENG